MFDMVRKIARHFREVIKDGGTCVCTTHMDAAIAKALESAERQKQAAHSLLSHLHEPPVSLETVRHHRRAVH